MMTMTHVLRERPRMNDRDTDERFLRYREQLDALTGSRSTVYEIEPRVPEDGRVLAVAYTDTPEPGHVTGFTYGLSLVRHRDRPLDARELSIIVRSDDVEWARVPAKSVAALRGMCAYDPGQAVGYMKRYVENSAMSSIVLAEPAGPWKPGPIALKQGGAPGPQDTDLVEIVGVYPVHASERDYVYSHGIDALWQLDWDRFDPLRPPVA